MKKTKAISPAMKAAIGKIAALPPASRQKVARQARQVLKTIRELRQASDD